MTIPVAYYKAQRPFLLRQCRSIFRVTEQNRLWPECGIDFRNGEERAVTVDCRNHDILGEPLSADCLSELDIGCCKKQLQGHTCELCRRFRIIL